ncbi:Alpha/Beta hydrolase protein [Microdochium trichocladiopsis]|uniref:Alpha/Beta hydrolase protein n=1 Tax=Microdochium trichocladiopsis TaxID=1682393 RepID=A0A9P8YFQ3_9PEZI|nr:Alpha/Beta hydrolase protein [Microdochium trichocladiopsis]KAH7040907.1 Alpha/Beta hydrolase protein [Microdochium trichocladiopsis]
MVTMRASTRAAAAAALLAASAGASAVHIANNNSHEPRRAAAECSDVHIFLARGNNEPYPGRQGDLVAAICKGVDSCDYEDLLYSARYTDLYCQIVYDGVIAGHTQLAAYASRCPKSKLVLGGYSVGAQVITDILAGAGGTFYNGCVQPSAPPLSRENAPGNMIAAVLVSGNVRHTGGEPFNTGTGSGMSGMFPRTGDQKAALDGWADILRDECIETDPICGNKSLKDGAVVADHLSYFARLTGDFAQWVQKKAQLDTGGSFVTAIPTSVSGTVQDYATIGTETPSGGVTMSPDWTKSTAVVAATTTDKPTSSSTDKASSSAATSSSPASSSTPGQSSGSTTAPPASTTPTPTDPVQGNVSPSSTPPPNAAARLSGAAWALVASGLSALVFAL